MRHEEQSDAVHSVISGRLFEADRRRRVENSSLLRTLKDQMISRNPTNSHAKESEENGRGLGRRYIRTGSRDDSLLSGGWRWW